MRGGLNNQYIEILLAEKKVSYLEAMCKMAALIEVAFEEVTNVDCIWKY